MKFVALFVFEINPGSVKGCTWFKCSNKVLLKGDTDDYKQV